MLRFLSARELPEHRRPRGLVRATRASSCTRRSASCRSSSAARATAGTCSTIGRPRRAARRGSPSSATATGEMHSVLGVGRRRPGLRARGAERRGAALLTATIDEQIERVFLDLPADDAALDADRRPRRGGARAPAAHVARRRRRAAHPPPRRPPPRPDAARGRPLDHPRLRGRARALAARAPPQALAAARRRRHAALVRLRRVGVAAAARRARARRAGRRRRARASSTATSTRSTRRCCPRAGRRPRSCCRSSSSRRRSTNCATSSTTGPTGCRSPSPASPACWRPRSRHERRDRHRQARRTRARTTRTRSSARTRSTAASSIRALRPMAESVVVQPAGARRSSASTPPGLFEGEIAGATLPLRYELEVTLCGRRARSRCDDPYRFAADAVGDLDDPPLRRGPPRQLWTKLGAHVRELDGVAGTSFAVWAPAARSVSVVGDFNYWDGRLHPMRALGGSGIWELFIPGVGEGALYKYEVRTAGRRAPPEGRPVRLRDRAAAADRVDRQPLDVRVGRRRVARRAQAARAARAGRCRSTRCTSARGG